MMGTTYICQHCGRPIGGIPTLLSGNAYHYECTQSPYAKSALKEKKYLYVINNWGSLRLSEGKTLQSNEFLVAKIEVQDD